ncbi:MAG TPA: ATPase domain-containing protein [Thermoplasmata archaeon]|nr:ATPase domain-containing protein [Thermoplasmata archaeon]
MARLATGIEGFDAMVQGGLPIGSSVLLQGPPGQEKLRFALTFLADGLKAGASGLVLISSQSPDAVLAELRDLGVNLDAVSKENRLRIVDWYSWSEEPVHDVEDRGAVVRSSIDLTNLGVALSRAIASLQGDQPRRAVIEVLSPATNVYEVSQVYAFAQSAKKKFDRYRFTSLVLLEKEMHTSSEMTTLHQPFDGVIEIERSRSGDRIVRKIGVLHLKDTAPDPTFRVLEMTEAGLKVVREPPPTPSPVAAVPGPSFESQQERSRRLHLILQIASERLKLNPRDADALFALAAAQATLDDAKAGVQSLDRLAELDPNYPGLWVLKTKLHARLGQADLARQSRIRALQTEPEKAPVAGPSVGCPMCDASVSVDATSCENCGVRFAPARSLEDELDDLGHAAIQEIVQEELAAQPTPVPEAKPPTPEAPKPAPKKPPAKPTSKRGMTNGLVLERGPSRRQGMTNGLKGRTNGLRGRTNGLTNGLRGRTNGLTNGLGRTNGLTNGIGRTNGLTNGLGRTNGLTNGLGRTNGLTNGLGRTNGITNGLGRTNGMTNGLGGGRPTGFHSTGVRGMMRNAGWKLYLIPLVSVALLLMPLFFVPQYGGPTYPIQIDGIFADWAGVPRVTASGAAVNPNIDITQVAVTDNVDFLSFYMQVRGLALEGDSTPARTTDTFFVFIDTDRSAATGYQIQGLGADRLIEIDGWGGTVVHATIQEFDANRDPTDWGGWFKGTPVQAAGSGNAVEFQANWAAILQPKGPIDAAFAARSWDRSQDVADSTATNLRPFVAVHQQTAAPQLAVGLQTEIASFTIQAVGGASSITSLNVTLAGTFGLSTFSSIALADSTGGTLARASVSGGTVQFAPLLVPIADGQTVTLRVRPEIATADGTTVGASLASPRDVVAGAAGVALSAPTRTPASLAYVGTIPSGVRIDGGFADWATPSIDPTGDVLPRPSPDLDLSAYGFRGWAADAFFMVRTVGASLNGTLLPGANPVYAGNASAPADSDRDGVPDSVDPMPYDFNNDGIPDVSTNGDYDGDGVIDYGFPGGTDYWLNTTIPLTFPAPYAGRMVSVYIGPVQRPVARGLDVARFYLDQDGSVATGYSIGGIGADYLVEVDGKEGRILDVRASRFNGTSPGEWAWTGIGPASAAKDRSRIEASVAGVTVTNASLGFFELTSWSGSHDDTSPAAPMPSPAPAFAINASAAPATASADPGSVHTLDISGNQQWFFTSGSTTATGCTTNLAASTTAGTSATSTTLSGTQSICWFTPLDVPDSISGVWEVILDTTQVSAGTTGLAPTANGDVNAWTISGGGNCNQEANEWRCVDDSPNDGDTTYVSSTSSSPTFDSIYNLADWSAAPSPLTITNVNIESSCRRLTGSAVSVKILVKSGGTTTAGATSQNCANSATYTVWSEDWATNPTTSSAWTLSDINALQAGVRDADSSTLEVRVSHVRVTVTFVPVYSVEIDRCTNSACSTLNVLYGPTNGNAFGSDVTFTTGTIAAQTLGATERIRFKVTMVAGGSMSVRYNGAYPGTDDSRATVPVPEFSEVGPVAFGTMLVALIVRRQRARRWRRENQSR